MLNLYKDEAIHKMIDSKSNGCIESYGRILICATSSYLEMFFVLDEKNAQKLHLILKALTDNKTIIGVPALKSLEDDIGLLLNSVIEIGDNAAEFSLHVAQYFIEYLSDGDKDKIKYMDISFLNVSDYIAQEHELKKDHATESEIEQSQIMTAYRSLRNRVLEYCDKDTNEVQSIAQDQQKSLCSEYVDIVKRYTSITR
ncbi:hypothetical protein [Deinococcus frigens]|uniref:hypothetical protein n=1 Tax=Deinococcus frigens TaxID=249403 RepID=UPI0012EBD37F|nr:hypothetical protein [Deinococcus frigens]